MSFDQFIFTCILRLVKQSRKLTEDKLYFQYTYYPDLPLSGSSYKCQVKGTKIKIYITPNEEVCQYYNKDDRFINLGSLSECLNKFVEEL